MLVLDRGLDVEEAMREEERESRVDVLVGRAVAAEK